MRHGIVRSTKGSQGMMKRWIVWTMVAAMALAGCSKHPPMSSAPMAGQKAKQEALLAYSHWMDVRLPAEAIPARIDAVRKACLDATFGACNLLAVDESDASGSITVRIVPDGVEGLTSLGSKGGKVASRRTSAEDISQAVHDTQRDRDQLEAYAKRLDDIAARKDLGVSDLLTVSHEQAEVAQKRRALENTAAEQKHRLDTNELRISYSDPRVHANRLGFSDLGDSLLDDMIEGLQGALSALAQGLPFLILGFPLALLWYWLWRKATRRWRTPR
ncbi:DUF4349 domain-containing protein [Bacillus sp. NP157]|nr:DUF4349 domain-containing protein [Bacillus sp. NP157]